MDEREIRRVVRSAAESVYGVSAVVGPSALDRIAKALGVGSSGVEVESGPPLAVTVDLRVAETVPHPQVAANVAEKVRYAVQRDLGTAIDRLTVRIDGQALASDAPASESHGS